MNVDAAVIFHLCVNTAIAAGLVWIWHDLRRDYPALAAVFAVGALGRITLGLTLFLVSWFDVQAFSHLHSGDGFWQLAPDARSYYRDASAAASHGLRSVSDLRGSYGYVVMLAGWMRLVGVHPLAGMWLNVVLYAGSLLLLARAASASSETRRVVLPAAVGFSFAPLFVVHSTQPLKEALLAAQLVIGAAALSVWIQWIRGRMPGRGTLAMGALVLCIGSILLMGSIRTYYAWLIWGALSVALVVFAPFANPRRLGLYVTHAALALSALWIASNTGAGPNYQNPAARWAWNMSPTLSRVLDARVGGHDSSRNVPPPASAVAELNEARDRFEETEGDTHVSISPALSRMLGHQAAAGVTGIALMICPVSFLKAVGLVDFRGGRGLLLFADIDIIVCDLVLIVSLIAAQRVRRAGTWMPELWLFSVLLSVIAALLMAYVVTNYGALVRLRMLAIMPLWAFPAAFVARRGAFRMSSLAPAGS
jgi:hypothetical protein